jgi:hypothetical protein
MIIADTTHNEEVERGLITWMAICESFAVFYLIGAFDPVVNESRSCWCVFEYHESSVPSYETVSK